VLFSREGLGLLLLLGIVVSVSAYVILAIDDSTLTLVMVAVALGGLAIPILLAVQYGRQIVRGVRLGVPVVAEIVDFRYVASGARVQLDLNVPFPTGASRQQVEWSTESIGALRDASTINLLVDTNARKVLFVLGAA
jgi:hypothetical protein